MPVRIVTDSVADLPPQVVQELGITVVPLHVRFGEEVYLDGVDLTAEQFYDKLAHSKILPVTSVPSPASFAEAYDKLAEEADEILATIPDRPAEVDAPVLYCDSEGVCFFDEAPNPYLAAIVEILNAQAALLRHRGNKVGFWFRSRCASRI